MRVAAVVMTAVCLAASGAACGRRAEAPAVPQELRAPLRLRGTLLATDSTMVFFACGTTGERPVRASKASQLRDALAAVSSVVRPSLDSAAVAAGTPSPSLDSMYVEFLGDTTGGVLTVTETLFATVLREGSRCDQARPLFAVEALGTEPYWRVTLDSNLLVLERPEPPRELVFDAAAPVTRGTLTTYQAHRALGKVHELTFGLLREPCRDGMSDSWYPYRAEVRFGDVALHGCARK